MSDYLDPNNEELLKDFFVEAELQVEALESNILVLESNPGDSDAIDEIFRAAHTLKGASATVQMNELAEFTHIVEDVLDAIRSGTAEVNSERVDTLLRSIDVIKEMLTARSNGYVSELDTQQLRHQLVAMLKGSAEQPVATEGSAAGLSEYDSLELVQAAADNETVYRVEVSFNRDNPMNTVGGIQVFAALKKSGRVLKTVPDFEALYEDNFFPLVEFFVASSEAPDTLEQVGSIPDVTTAVTVSRLGEAAPVSEKASELPPSEAPSEARQEPAAAATVAHPPENSVPEVAEAGERRSGGSVLRVESKRVDNLLNLVSETVINKAGFNQLAGEFSDILHLFETSDHDFRDTLKALFDALPGYLEQMQKGATVKQIRKELISRFSTLYTVHDQFESDLKSTVTKFRSYAQNLGRITGELQEGVMRIRMVPIAQVFSRFPRLMRDLSRSLDKKIQLEIEGEDTELDKSVIEDLLDPLIHCVRNSVDHGVEAPAQRIEAGKSEQGTVSLKASNEGNMIVIEIADDGRGIDVEKVRARAIERGVIHAGKTLTDVEAYNLIFDPGFSTAATITNVSGRGVGLDVVKRQIEKLNGTVSVWSELGQGTRFTIKIPLTLAIIQGLLVRVGTEMYAIPITSVIDSHRIRPSEIKLIDNYEVFNVRDDVVSLLRLNRLFHIATDENKDYYFVVIVGSGDKKMGLVVDSLIGEEDVVIKPLRDHYTNAPGIAGANITGDGTVCLIIDVGQLLDLGLKHEMEQRKRQATTIR
ncbi:MAG: chemotaxis protein CheA [Spirochaetaceae bacterium]|nr:MAG: chemotaxis protein CheA [Spirochaetaceae bacterium]